MTNSGAVQRAQERRQTRRALTGLRRERATKGFFMMVHAYWQSEQYAKLSPRAVKLLVDLCCQYRGINNGDLTTAWSVMRERGWRSKHLLYKAQQELERRGWIIKTRQGLRAKGRHSATLWALTFEGIDHCVDAQGRSKLDSGIRPDSMPLHLWRAPGYDRPLEISRRAVRKNISSPRAGASLPESRGNVAAFPDVTSREPGRKCG